jgi:DNA-binding transcriptional MerR regulator
MPPPIDSKTYHCYDTRTADPSLTLTYETNGPMDTDHNQPRWNLTELTQEAGVSVRTVRYYIAEGLLPPPDANGPRSFYTQGHLDRLRLIDRLKASYLPLKEIRRRLSTLDDGEVRHLLESENTASPPMMRAAPASPPDSASNYIARLLNTPQSQPQPGRSVQAPAPAAPPPMNQTFDEDETIVFALPPVPATRPSAAAEPDTTSWRRISLSDDAELLIRDDTYQRKRDRVEWLIDWARKVFS